jgi:hypothetical protein
MPRGAKQRCRTSWFAGIEQVLRHRVLAFMSANHMEPDVAAEIFLLDARATTARSERTHATIGWAVACDPPLERGGGRTAMRDIQRRGRQ